MIIPPGFAHATLRWLNSGDPDEWISTFGVRLQAGVTDPVAVAGDCTLAWLDGFPITFLSNDTTFVGTTVTMGSDGGDGPTGEDLVGAGGTAVSSFLPSNCSLLIRKRTNLGGRRNRGRMYVPACYVGESTVDQNGVIQSSSVGEFQTAADDFLTAIEASTSIDRMVILHSESPATPTLVTSLAVDSQIATQRRRMRR